MKENEDIELIKTKLKTDSELQDILNNPVVNLGVATMEQVPWLGSLVKTTSLKALEEKVRKNERELIDSITKNRNVTSDQVNDVDFLNNFVKTVEAVRRLTSNDKIIFFGNLLRNGYLSEDKISSDLFDECYERIHEMSYRELIWLWKYYIFCGDDLKNHEKWNSFKKELSREDDISEELIANVFTSLMRTGLVKQVNAMFPDGQNENPFILTDLFIQFADYVMKEY